MCVNVFLGVSTSGYRHGYDMSAHLGLHHGWPLRPQHLDRLEDVDHALVPHPLQHDAEGDEDPGPAHPRTETHVFDKRKYHHRK